MLKLKHFEEEINPQKDIFHLESNLRVKILARLIDRSKRFKSKILGNIKRNEVILLSLVQQ